MIVNHAESDSVKDIHEYNSNRLVVGGEIVLQTSSKILHCKVRSFSPYGKQFFTSLGKEFFTSYGKEILSPHGKEFFT